jgi:DNA excision repair protein ERCC-2
MGEAIQEAQANLRHLLVEAGTGTGKTVVALAASLASCHKDQRRLLWACRTNSQQQQVATEHAALQAAGLDPGLLIPFMGRRNYCPLLRSDARFLDGTAEELGRLCRDAKAKATTQVATGQPVEGACPYYAKLLRDGPGPVEALLRTGGLSGTALGDRVEKAGSCPYEALKLLLPKANAVAVPFVFLLDDRLRRTLLDWMGVPSTEVHLVLDEAHHLPEAAREHASPRLTATTLQRAQKEAEEVGDPVLAKTTPASVLLKAVLGALHRLTAEHVQGEDGLVPPGALDEELLTRLRVPTPHLQRLADDLGRWGDVVREDRRKKGRLPRSYLAAVAGFLDAWLATRSAPTVQLVEGGGNPALELYLLDPSAVLGWLSEFASTVQMSGTLDPLAEHRLLCGLDPATTTLLKLPSPFDRERLRIYGVEGIERRFEAIRDDPAVVGRQQDLARAILARSPGRTGLFFTSHAMLRDYVEEGFLHGIDRPLYKEAPGMSETELMALVTAFQRDATGRALLLAVLGGRLTEGMDFPGKALEHVLLFGVPYPRPSARSQALIHHYDRVAGNGWAVAVHNPVGRTMRQAIGRLIRGPEDSGTAVILDDRAVRFHAHLPGLRMVQGPDQVMPPGVGRLDEGYQTADRLQERSS